MHSELNRLRRTVDHAMLVLLWLHAPLIGLIAWANAGAWVMLLLVAVAVAGAATTAVITASGSASRLTVAVALIAMVSLVLAAASGTTWQTDLHMYYFAALAILAAYCDRNVIIAGATVTAVHHLALNFLAPSLVFPEGSDLKRVMLHAAIVVL